MPVGSVLELYTSVLAWNLYGALWALLTNTGLVLIPFIATLVNTLLSLREANETSNLTALLEFWKLEFIRCCLLYSWLRSQ